MNRRLFLALTLTSLLGAAGVLAADTGLSKADREASLRFVTGCRNDDGGFRVSAQAAPSDLGAMVSGTRATYYLKGTVANPEAAAKFVDSCWNGTGYAAQPGQPVQVRTTAMGLMARAQLGLPHDERTRIAARYLVEKAASIPEIYLSAAAIDASKLPFEAMGHWSQAMGSTRNADGSYGKSAYDTATVAATLLRMGRALPDEKGVLTALRAGQREDGGFAEMGDASDLASTYRTMRAFWMMKQKPDVAKLKAFIGRCRNADGGYGPQPGKPSTLPATYHAAILLTWLNDLK